MSFAANDMIAIIYVETFGRLLRKNMLRRLYDNRQSIDDDTFPNQRITNVMKSSNTLVIVAISGNINDLPTASELLVEPRVAEQKRLADQSINPSCGRCVCFNRFRNNSIDLASWTRIHGTMTVCSRAHATKAIASTGGSSSAMTFRTRDLPALQGNRLAGSCSAPNLRSRDIGSQDELHPDLLQFACIGGKCKRERRSSRQSLASSHRGFHSAFPVCHPVPVSLG